MAVAACVLLRRCCFVRRRSETGKQKGDYITKIICFGFCPGGDIVLVFAEFNNTCDVKDKSASTLINRRDSGGKGFNG